MYEHVDITIINNGIPLLFSDVLLGFRYGLLISLLLFITVFAFSEVLLNAIKSLFNR